MHLVPVPLLHIIIASPDEMLLADRLCLCMLYLCTAIRRRIASLKPEPCYYSLYNIYYGQHSLICLTWRRAGMRLFQLLACKHVNIRHTYVNRALWISLDNATICHLWLDLMVVKYLCRRWRMSFPLSARRATRPDDHVSSYHIIPVSQVCLSPTQYTDYFGLIIYLP